FVLYYHDRSLPPSSVAPPHPCRRPSSSSSSLSGGEGEVVLARHATEEAVRFAGLCRALRSLPRSLGPRCLRDDNVDWTSKEEEEEGEEVDEAEVVHLGESTLVYVPLELGGDVFAVAQVPRRARRAGSSLGCGADPMSDAVLRMHAEFALLYGGGGVHRSLLRTRHLESTNDWSIEVVVATSDKDDGRNGDYDDGGCSGSDRLKIKDDARWELPRKSSSDSEICVDGINLKKSGPCELPRISWNGNGYSGSDGLKIKDDACWELPVDDHGPVMKPIAEDSKQFSWYQSQGKRREDNNKRGGLARGGSSVLEEGLRPSRRKMSTSRVGSHDSGDDDGDHIGYYRYGGMEELFALRRERRDLLTRDPLFRRRWSSSSNSDVEKDLRCVDCDRRIEALLPILPITALRDALAGHYDDRLRRIQAVCDATGGSAGRRSVEAVPPSIVRRGRGDQASPEPIGGQHPPSAPNPLVCLAAAEFMTSMMRDQVPELADHGKLIGMSFLCRDRLVLSDAIPRRDEDGRCLIELSPELLCMIVEHFRFFREKFNADDIQSNFSREELTQNGNGVPLSRWRLGGTKKIENAAQQGSLPLDGNEKCASNRNDDSGFVTYPSPPTNDNAPINSLFVRNKKKHVWLQRIFLPCFNVVDIDDEVEILVAMFEREEITFLLFFERPSSHESKSPLAQMAEELQPKTRKLKDGKSKPVSGATKAFVDVLNNLEEAMAQFCNMYSHYVADSLSVDTASARSTDSKNIFCGEPGINIISIDRNENSFVLLNQHDLSSKEFKRSILTTNGSASPTPSNPTFGIFGIFGIGSKQKVTPG
ncbi:LOW QUALITY PROTEIN: hypothetical protein ACHAXA_009360, partial [Cyclostephanos tholiformis]